MHLAAAYPSLACRLEPGLALQLHCWRSCSIARF